MACATLNMKRTHDFDPLNQMTPKRRRCAPMPMSSSPPPAQVQHSIFSDAGSKFCTDQIATEIKHEIIRLRHRKKLKGQRHLQRSASATQSASGPACSTSASDVQQSFFNQQPSNTSVDMQLQPLQDFDQAYPTLGAGPSSPTSPSSPNGKDMPLLTIRQVGEICERMLKEREDEVREEFSKVLQTKLAEQYEQFMKYHHDHLDRHHRTLSGAHQHQQQVFGPPAEAMEPSSYFS